MNIESPRAKSTGDPARSLSRAVGILQILAGPRSTGMALTEIAERADLPHPTTLRLLKHMVGTGLVATQGKGRTYILGPLAFELGLAAARHFDIRGRCEPSLRRLAEIAKDTVYLVQRSGYDAVCIDRREGLSPIRVLTLESGSRRPLGVGAGGLAILSALEDDQIRDVIAHVSNQLKQYLSLDPHELMDWVARSREQGYAASGNRVTLGVTAIGVPILDRYGRPFAAISIASIHERMPSDRQRELAKLLKDEAKVISRQIGNA